MPTRPFTRRFTVLASLVIGLAILPNPVSSQTPAFDPAGFTLNLELVVDGLDQPVHVVDAGSGRFFIVDKGGRIRILDNGALLDQPLLDISGQVSGGSEQGLLSMALHPDFAENGTFVIDYTDTDGNSQIERWQLSADDPNRADPERVETLLSVDQPHSNHNGGLVMFGPDGYLYIGFGDGGSQGDPYGNGQNLGVLLGKILRIDIDGTDGDRPYGIPPDNPYIDRDDARGEIFAYGLRNPWRFSFDRDTGDLMIADVGGSAFEEVNISPAGQSGLNFGWVLMEGPECRSDECEQADITPPIFAYTHDFGCSITGGYVYRGGAIPALSGAYLAGDYCSGLVWAIDPATGTASEPVESGLSISSFAEDAAGELYVVDLGGAIYKIVT